MPSVTATPVSRSEGRPARRWMLALVLGVLAIAVPTAGILVPERLRAHDDWVAVQLLAADSVELRQAGARQAARSDMYLAHAVIAQALAEQREAEPGLREAYVYALGRSGNSRYCEFLEEVVLTDTDGYVRQAAWLAAARLDPGQFRAWADQVPPRDDGWDRIGRAAAWLETSDVRGIDELLHWAVAGDDEQRRVAVLALYRGVAPLLEAAGRWPIQFDVREGDSWSPELVAAVQTRCGELNLQAIADDTRPHAAQAAIVRRNLGRLNAARAYLVRWLGAG